MKAKVIFSSITFFLLSVQICSAQDKFSTTEKLLLQTERQIVDAVIKTDTTIVSSLLSASYTYTLPDGKIITRKQYLSDIALWWRPVNIEHSDQKVTIYGKAAVVIGKAKYRWKNKKEEIEEAIEQYTDTYVKIKKQWIRVSSHASCLSGRCT
jgi:hypothetical protein